MQFVQDLGRRVVGLRIHNIVQQKVANETDQCARNPVTGTIYCGNVRYAFFLEEPGEVATDHILGPVKDERARKVLLNVPGLWQNGDLYALGVVDAVRNLFVFFLDVLLNFLELRSEERRVGKECRFRWWPDD